MEENDISKKYAGLNVFIQTIYGLHKQDESDKFKTYKGRIVDILPNKYIKFLDELTGEEKKLPFAGTTEGIASIFLNTQTKESIYLNPAVGKAYSHWGYVEDSPMAPEPRRQNIASQGKFSW
ncbi:hypothetical protein JW756_06845 [Candidatus Woesearchaeota archaeon]|nr:hypothetical protein [Candidatus Woesearchaeota archaeon]